jgi:predicted NodU family carbamoyl transferase
MTRVLGLNYARGRSSIVSTRAGRIVEGRVLADPAFPRSTIRNLKDPHNDWEYATCHVPSCFSDFKTQLRSVSTARPVLVDYREALAMSSISMSNWTTCAVMIVDSDYCGLGYYAQGQFHWLREFHYPNSISLFYSAAARFLGFDPLINEHKLVEASQYGNPSYADLIEQKFVHTETGDYTLLQNLTRGIGRGPLNLDIAASVQAVFDKTILHLATWLANAVDCKRLAYAGRATSNYLTNTKIATFSGFNELLIQPLTSYAGAVVGAASLVSRSIFDTVNIGEDVNLGITPDDMAQKLLRGKIVPFINGKAEFCDSSLINRNWLAIPFTPIQDEFRKRANLTQPWEQPLVICQERDYATYYSNNIVPKYGQYNSQNLEQVTIQLTDKNTRVVAINNSSNAYLHRVIELLRVEGYPLLISATII